ncbi:ATP-dependent DNA helicase [Aeromicrobium sp. Root495]|uniref:ATP-dependent DNA helicase n=1 Tax=Aeromicrobium sp. Root495 TaxID=1736550 RepID=UPI0009E727E9|nr:ATP-dependent DNA helicase [Aeromicrobium sp. Root495]
MSMIRSEEHLSELLDIPFSRPQLDAITAPLEGTGAIIAGAGSGKTTVMAARVVWLVGHDGVAPERILGLTFTNKAAAELGVRIRRSLELLGVELDSVPTTSTYHAFAGQLIAEHGLRLGVEPDLRIVTDASRFQRMARVVETYEGDLAELSTYVPTLVTQAMNLDGQLSEHLVSTEELREDSLATIVDALSDAKPSAGAKAAAAAARKRIELSHLVDRYRAAKLSDGVMDFSDQMAWGARLAQQPGVAEALRERFDVVLLDEYQDTSVAQRDLLHALFGGHPATAVGDPAQGIYGWRGAATGNLENFVREFSGGGEGRHFSLVETRRCAPEIIGAANRLAAEFYATSEVVQPLVSAVRSVGQVDVALHETVQEEIDAVVQGIIEAHEAGTPWREIAVLARVTRENGAIVQELRRRDVPFEIVGLTGLLDQPEVSDVLALLEVVDDITANPSLLRLLTGPRFAVGPRDLALLGRRAASLSGRRFGRDEEATLAEELSRAVEGTDPTEIVSLADALDDLGELGYSPEARRRFTDLARIIRTVRAHVADPLLELARRAVRALDLDIELEASHVTGGSDNLALFLDAVAAYGETDRYASLGGLVAYLRAEDDFNEGLEVSTPTEADSVKLLTIHKSKGLEWDIVFVPLVTKDVFPGARSRPNWTTTADTLPWPLRGDHATLPELASWSAADLTAFKAAIRHESRLEELRLGYVAYTRARTRLVVTGHWWGRTQQKFRGPSAFLENTRAWLEEQGGSPVHWAPQPEDDATNPLLVQVDGVPWPAPAPRLEARHRLAALVRAELESPSDLPLPLDEELQQLEDDVELLLREAETAARLERVVDLPPTVSATSVLSLAQDEPGFARALARPMPRQPSTAARFGTRFHAWVEAYFGQLPLLDPSDLPGAGDADLRSDEELDEVIELFRTGPFADAVPFAIEAPFSLVLAGQQVIGRIDAVFSTGTPDDPSYEVVDWKTNRQATADPLQLAVYRLAFAELMGLPVEKVSGAFYYVRLGEVARFAPSDLPSRPELERLVTPAG